MSGATSTASPVATETASSDRLDQHADQLADHEDRLSTAETRLDDHDGQIAALRSAGGGGSLAVPVCDVPERFTALDARLQTYWSAHGPDAPTSCLAHPVGTDARAACSSYSAWYQFAVSCRSDRASEYAARVLEREGL